MRRITDENGGSNPSDRTNQENTVTMQTERDWKDRSKYVPLPKSFFLIPEGHSLLKGISFTNDEKELIGKYTFVDDKDGSDWYNDRSVKVGISKVEYLVESNRFYFVEGLGFIYSNKYEDLDKLADVIYPEESMCNGF